MSRTPALIAGTILTGVGLAFNASYGWSIGGGDILRSIGMAGVFIACVGLKDWMLGQSALAFKARRYGLGAACVIGLLIGAAGSFLAAFGSASEGRDAKADPRAAQIIAYQTAQKVAADTEKRLAVLGDVPNIEEAKARVSGLQAKLDAAREVIAKGAPKAADPLVANVQAFLATGIDAAAVLSLIVALIVELGAPVCWMIWQMSEPGKPAQAIPGIPANDAAVPGIVIPRNPFPGNDPPTGGRRGRKPDPRIVNFSEAFREKHGRPPSGSEIKSYFPGIPTSTAKDYTKRA